MTTTTTGRPWAWTHRRREGCQCRAMRPILRHAGPDPTSCWLLKAWPPASVSCPIGREVTSTRPSAPACGAAGGCRTGARREATSRATNPGSRIFRAFPRAWRQVGFDKVRRRWNEGRSTQGVEWARVPLFFFLCLCASGVLRVIIFLQAQGVGRSDDTPKQPKHMVWVNTKSSRHRKNNNKSMLFIKSWTQLACCALQVRVCYQQLLCSR